MKCVVLAYHSMGCAAIDELINAGFEIQAVFTHRDKAGENIWFDSVAEFAGSRGILSKENDKTYFYLQLDSKSFAKILIS